MTFGKKELIAGLSISILFLLSSPVGAIRIQQNSDQQIQAKQVNPQPVIYHLGNLNKAHETFQHIENHLNNANLSEINITVVSNGSGAFALVNDNKDKHGRSFEDYINQLSLKGVNFEICANTIRSKKIKKSKINANVNIVSSGVGRIISLQQQGYRYIKL